MSIVSAVVLCTLVGAVGAIILVAAAKFMAVEEDPRIEEVAGCLAGANCGGCGYAGCADYAKAVVMDGVPCDKCAPGGPKAAAAIAKIMGGTASVVEKKAVVQCQGNSEHCKPAYDYKGIQTCAAAAALYGGPKTCSFACVGLGDCTKVCKFDAIHIVDGVAKVDKDKCTGCGACANICPKQVLSLIHILSLLDLFMGIHGGVLGETCALAIVLGLIYLVATKTISIAIPASYVGSMFVFYLIATHSVHEALVAVLSGGLLFGAVFMATDYVTSPFTLKGKLVYGVALGIVTFAIRYWGSYTEGVSFALLFMNLWVPYINDQMCIRDRLICVTMQSELSTDKYNDVRTLLDYAFSTFTGYTDLPAQGITAPLSVVGGGGSRCV